MSWRELARCLDYDTGLFFPEVGEQRSTVIRARTEMAKQVCEKCPVKSACLDDALSRSIGADAWGVRGGLSAEERRNLRYRRWRERRSV